MQKIGESLLIFMSEKLTFLSLLLFQPFVKNNLKKKKVVLLHLKSQWANICLIFLVLTFVFLTLLELSQFLKSLHFVFYLHLEDCLNFKSGFLYVIIIVLALYS